MEQNWTDAGMPFPTFIFSSINFNRKQKVPGLHIPATFISL